MENGWNRKVPAISSLWSFNLKQMIPLAETGAYEWTLEEDGHAKISLKFQTNPTVEEEEEEGIINELMKNKKIRCKII